MRNFRYRLAPVQRLKNYQIEQKEQEISELDAKIENLLHEIEDGRQAVQDMRHRLLGHESDHNIIQAEQQMDMFRSYMTRMESQKRSEVRTLRGQKETKRQELIKLYQEEKILDRLREKKQADWDKEMRREESQNMDEIGTNNYTRRNREGGNNNFGGVLVYLLLPIAIAGTAALLAFYMGYIDQSMLQKIPIVGERLRSATPEVEIVSATPEAEEYFTVEDMIGELDAPMPEVLQQIASQMEQLRQKQQELAEWENRLERREAMIDTRAQQLADIAQNVTQSISILRDLETQREEREKSELSEREQELANMIESNKPKDIAPTLISMFRQNPLDTPEEAREKQLIILRLFHRMSDKNRAEMFGELSEEDPAVASELIQEYYATDTSELYGIVEESENIVEQINQNETNNTGANNQNQTNQNQTGAAPNQNQPDLQMPEIIEEANDNNPVAGQ